MTGSHSRGYRLSTGIALISLLGLALSVYALHVETSKLHNSSYRAFCDFGSSVSCSKVFTSKYGKGFGLIAPILGDGSILNQPNSIFGIIFYCIQICLAFQPTLRHARIALALALLSCIGSFYLAFVLTFVLHDFCVVCISTYVINAIVSFLDFKRMSLLRREEVVKKK